MTSVRTPVAVPASVFRRRHRMVASETKVARPGQSGNKIRHTLRGLDAASREHLRGQATSLNEAGYDYAAIGLRLHVTAIIARDLCLQHRRSIRRKFNETGPVLLPQTVVDLLLSGPYAALIAPTMARKMDLARICSLYTGAELLREQGLGRVTLIKIEGWLATQGFRLRGLDESVSEVVRRIQHHESQSMPLDFWQPVIGSASENRDQNAIELPTREQRETYRRLKSRPATVRDYEASLSASKVVH